MTDNRFIFTKKMIFMNNITGKQDYIDLIWKVEKGFSSVSELNDCILSEGLDPETFGKIKFLDNYYGVCISTNNRIVVLTSEHIFYKQGRYFTKYRIGMLHEPVYTISKGKVRTDRNDEFIRDFNHFDKYYTTVSGSKVDYKYNLEHNAISMLAMVSFDVKVPISQLDCMAPYKPDIPPYKSLSSQGIYSINPFSGETELVNNGVFSFDDTELS